jgi:putative phosphoribosyl transferase
MLYADRVAAGRALIEPLARFRGSRAVVLALPRGGVPVAAEVAAALGLPLGLALVRKVGVPGQRELAVAALAGPAGETLVINDDVARVVGLTEAEIDRLAAPERAELARRRTLWMGVHPLPDLAGRPVILVDDGLATGATMRAAVAWTRGQGASEVIAAVPVGAAPSVAALRRLADAVVCPHCPDFFRAVGLHYRDFRQVEDSEVRALLDAQAGPPPATPSAD